MGSKHYQIKRTILLFVFHLSTGNFPFQFRREVKTVFSMVASIPYEKTYGCLALCVMIKQGHQGCLYKPAI